MNINQLETLVTISKTMSFRKAGELLNLTQPAVSAQIKSLEDEFGTLLVDRNQPVTLTDSGKCFLEHAEKILQTVVELKQRLADMSQIPQGHIHIGTTASIAMQILPRVLSYFQEEYPLIKTTIHSMTSSQIMTAVENGVIDIGIAYLTDKNTTYEAAVLYYDTFELIVSVDHPLSQLTHVSIDKLRSLPFIMLSTDTAARKFVDDIFKAYEIIPNVVMELSSSEEVKRMVELNLGVSIISRLSAVNDLRNASGKLRIIKVEEMDITHPVGVIYKSGRYLSSAMQQFLRDLKGMPETHFLGSE
ncbi:LysR family transcriptional regulator [Paenibacillus sp. N1-5-1-14]|uniref:LysR family transcriptional regulator n=1 Tax=Paenibacillus radicibacter TaxID=2972488 RepID=UPI0021595C9F|nr:LysR family transcriptional regulator [Paenibacillus radicibacter]MCR8645234.1 LysR family transcriptional regulator [Paenibacillus radicibacter]